jgi:hypothetical protein
MSASVACGREDALVADSKLHHALDDQPRGRPSSRSTL